MKGRRLALSLAVLSGIAVGVAVVGSLLAPAMSLLVAVTGLLAVGVFLAPKPALSSVGLFLLLQTPIVNLLGGRESPLGTALQRAPEALLVVAVLRIAFLWRDLRAERAYHPWVWYAAGFAIAGAVSALLNQVPLFVVALGGFLAVKLVLFILLALTVPWTERDAIQLGQWMLRLGPALLISGVVLLQFAPERLKLFADPSAIQEGYFERGSLRSMQGPFPNPGVFGWLMAVVGCYGLAAVLAGRRAVGGGVLVASVLGIVGSLRRKPLVGLPIAALTSVWAVGSGRQRWAVLALLLVVGGTAATVARKRLDIVVEDTLTGYLDPYAPTAARTVLYAVGWQVARDHFPLGAGFGRYGGYVSEIRYSPLYDQYGISRIWGLSPDFPGYIEDTYWPHVLGETGVVGALFILCMFVLLWRALRRAARTPSVAQRLLAIAGGMVLVEALVESLSAPVFEASLQAFVIGIPIGMALSLHARATAPVPGGLPLPTTPSPG